MNRREFLMWVGIGGVASSLPVALVACSPKAEKSQSPTIPTRADGFQRVGTIAELQKGSILKKDFSSNGSVLVVSNPANSKTVLAVNPICTHKGCAVEWKADEKSFICPCHDAKFSADGKVLKGPANKPLATYEAKTEGDAILVKAG